MPYLLDTCAISDARTLTNEGLLDWLARRHETDFYISAISVAELRRGIQRTRPTERDILLRWLPTLGTRFTGRLLAFDDQVALAWGDMMAASEASGRRTPLFDSLIAATAIAHGLTVVTRHVRDFERTGAKVLNPWS